MNILDYIDYRQGKLWVTESFLTDRLPWADWSISVNTIRNGTRKYRKHQSDRWENFSHIKLQRQVLINIESIDFSTLAPFKSGAITPPSRDVLYNLYISATEANRQSVEADLIDTIDNHWMAHFRKLDEKYYQDTFKVNKTKGDTKANHLAQAIAILRLLDSDNLCGFSSKKSLMQSIAHRVNELSLYGKGINSYDRLKKTLTKFRQAPNEDFADKRDVVTYGQSGNKNRLKFDEVHRTAALNFYLGLIHQQKPDKYASWQDYCAMMIHEHKLTQQDCISYSRFKEFTLKKEIEDMAAKVRHGSSYYEAYVAPFVLGKEMERSMTLVAGDGWEPGRSVAYTWRNPKTGKTEKRTGTMNVWIWWDVKSKMVLSHHIAPFENSHQIRMSFRDIINLWGVCPRSAMVDKKWMEQSDTQQMFERADVFLQGKKAYSPKTNPAERNNKEANKIHRYLDEGWVNMTMNHSLQSQHNDEKLRGAAPMKEADFRAMVYQIIERHNYMAIKSLNGRTPHQVMSESIDPKCLTFDPLELSWIFADKRISTVYSYNVDITLASTTHTFMIPAESIRAFQKANPYKNKVRVYYDERHLDTVDLYAFTDKEDESTDTFICTAINKEKRAVSRSSVEGLEDPNHGRNLGWQKKRKDTLDQIIDEEMEHLQIMNDSLGWDNASYMNASQERYKEAHSNAVAAQYRDYHTEREEDEGKRVNHKRPAPNQVIDEDEKYRLMKERQAALSQEE